MELDSPIWILGQRYTIEAFDACARDNDLGNCDVNKCHIGYWRGLPEDSKRDVVLHEILHALYFLMAVPDNPNEEDVVTRLSTGLTCTLLDPRNESFTDWFYYTPLSSLNSGFISGNNEI